jgi:tetratricopeptide (TPR) repeat protein
MNEYDKALQHALTEYNRRPNNIDVNETVAWVYYKKDEIQKAIPYINAALKTGSANPSLLCHAGLIYAKASDKIRAKQLLETALKNNPNIDLSLKEESAAVLKTL